MGNRHGHEFQVGGCGQLHPLGLCFWAMRLKLWREQGVEPGRDVASGPLPVVGRSVKDAW